MTSFKETSRHEYIARINRVLEYIDENISEKLSLEKLSDVSCFSQFHFHRVFHAFLGETPNDFVARVRLEKAANFLSYGTTDSVTEIALKYGFSSSAAFARAFKSHFGYSASEWRNGAHVIYKNSKIGKTDSKTGKEALLTDDYVSSVNNYSVNKSEESEVKIDIRQMPKLHVAYITVFDGYGDNIGVAYEKLCRWGRPRGLLNQNTKFLGIAFDSPDTTPFDKCRYSACITVPENTLPEKEINIKDIPEAKCLVAHFNGPKSGISKFYDELFKIHLPQNGFLPDDIPAYEIYLNDPKTDPDAKFILDAYIPVKPL